MLRQVSLKRSVLFAGALAIIMIFLPASLFLWLPRWSALGVFLILFGSGLILWFVPRWQLAGGRAEELDAKALADLEDAYRRTLTQILGGTAVLIGIYFTWSNLVLSQRTLEQSERRATAEMFSQATEQLSASLPDGSPRVESRLGGIYTLKQIGKTDLEYFQPIISLFNAYLRANARHDNSPQVAGCAMSPFREDILAVFEALGDERWNGAVIIAPSLSLRGYRMLHGSYTIPELANADFSCSQFLHVSFTYADLHYAKFDDIAVEHRLDFTYGDLRNASFHRAKLAGASFSLTNLSGADFEGADLNSTVFKGVDLTEVQGLTCDQSRPPSL